MNLYFFKRIRPEAPLRLGLGLMYIYSGWDLIVNPSHWQGFAPAWFERMVGILMPMDTYLRLQGAGELAIALLLLAWFVPRRALRLAALLAALEMAGILILVGIDAITFRDLGLFGGALALWIMSWRGADAI